MFTKFCKFFSITFAAVALLSILLTLLGHNNEYTGFMDAFFNKWAFVGDYRYYVKSWIVFAYLDIALVLSALVALAITLIGKKPVDENANKSISFWHATFFTILFFFFVSLVAIFFIKGMGIVRNDICGYAMLLIILTTLASAFIADCHMGLFICGKKKK